MRTGLITFHFAHHYGAQLQALATMRAIQSLGHDCEIIDYRLPHTTRTNQLFKKSGGVRGMASDAHTALHYGAFQRRFRRFEAFVAEEMALSPRRYTAFEQLRADPPAYDVYVAGSDQIWNPYIFQDKQFDPSFLLGFVREGRRIAYAPSLGVPELPEDKAEELRRFLTPFSALSVREKRGQVLLREAAGRDARVVLDPTLLLTGEDWGELAAAPKRQGPYILCYFVSDPGEAAPYALALSARTGWPIVQLAGARRKIDGAAELVFDAGPREFLGLFRHASAVVTNSFHGAAFSLQFQKDFFTSMSPRERAEPTFSRIYSLLSRLGCADRILGLELGADDYIVKPFSPREVVARIKAVLRRVNESAAEDTTRVLRFDGLTINLANYEVKINDKQVPFTPKEVEILYLLASHPGQVFDREQILSRVWGYDYFGDTRAVDTQIKRIRQKFPEDAKGFGIRTIYGVGYKFEVEQ